MSHRSWTVKSSTGSWRRPPQGKSGSRSKWLFVGVQTDLLPLLETIFPELDTVGTILRWLLHQQLHRVARSETAVHQLGEGEIGIRQGADQGGGVGVIDGSRRRAGGDDTGPVRWGRMEEIDEAAIAFPDRRGNLYNIEYSCFQQAKRSLRQLHGYRLGLERRRRKERFTSTPVVGD
ncbi:hypothetical protein B296_00041259 [Ensete ventricosum]|uniref:Uncharacterized protein n=1 Tax=Ensete ventricosum TaxID=4639 RepID=A0A426XZB7_ENSVE|nr:hypothetical protein B296_00041259 [Ensete ventricosum]